MGALGLSAVLTNPLTLCTSWSARADDFACIFVPLHYWSILRIISVLRACHPEFHCTWYDHNEDYSDSFVLGMQNFTSWFRTASTLRDIIRGHGKRYFSGILPASVFNRNVNKKTNKCEAAKKWVWLLRDLQSKKQTERLAILSLIQYNFLSMLKCRNAM